MRLPLQYLLTLLAIATLILTACGPVIAVPEATLPPNSGPEITASPTDTAFPQITVPPSTLQDLRIQVWHAFSGTSALVFTSRMAHFNTTNAWGIIVDQTILEDYPALFEAVDLALKTNAAPDLVVALPEQTLAWNTNSTVVDLNAYIDDPQYGMGTDLDDIPSVFLEQDLVEKRQLGLPAERSARFLFYNLTWARELGFEQPPVNSAEFRAQACAANATFRLDASELNDGYGGWIIDADWMTIHPWLLAFGGDVSMEGTYRFKTAENQAALEFLKRLRDDGCAWMTADPATPYALDLGPHYAQFARRSALFITGDLTEADYLSTELARLGATDIWTMIPFPGPVDQAITAYGPSYTLLHSTPGHQLAAWLFIRWMLSPDSQADWVEQTGTLPLRTSAISLLTDYSATHPHWQAAVAAIPLAHSVPQFASWRTMRYVLADGTLSIFRMNLPPAMIPDVLSFMDDFARELGSGE